MFDCQPSIHFVYETLKYTNIDVIYFFILHEMFNIILLTAFKNTY